MNAWQRLAGVLAAMLVAAGCGPAVTGESPEGTAEPTERRGGTVTLYSSVTQETVDAVLVAYRERHPDVDVELFRAPTGELNARLAAEQREGGIRADVVWLTDPLSMQQYAADGLLRRWTPADASAVPDSYRTEHFWGTRVLSMVIVHRQGLQPAPTSWEDLTDAAYDQVAIPDPGFAGSAFGALAFFALDERYGMDYYRALADAGAVQVQAPGDVITGVAEGTYDAGMTLRQAAREAIDKGSPMELVWPDPGAVALYSPIAVFDSTDDAADAESFAGFVLSQEAQEAIADTGWQPVRDDVPWADTGPQVAPDWSAAFDRQAELLEEYRDIFGG